MLRLKSIPKSTELSRDIHVICAQQCAVRVYSPRSDEKKVAEIKFRERELSRRGYSLRQNDAFPKLPSRSHPLLGWIGLTTTAFGRA
jgi:hypothetical protein